MVPPRRLPKDFLSGQPRRRLGSGGGTRWTDPRGEACQWTEEDLPRPGRKEGDLTEEDRRGLTEEDRRRLTEECVVAVNSIRWSRRSGSSRNCIQADRPGLRCCLSSRRLPSTAERGGTTTTSRAKPATCPCCRAGGAVVLVSSSSADRRLLPMG
ncbi:hypothetical protein TNCT_277751 [Trichonephila clavata]|uniref:Uncharacterized protein n=1 Tax=Trichonephila clavata TaxID=2740835 RepID=A0A8X6FKC1_TRICU|nr:hypothetical protein TNCT_277751 [Trichonephila clavata]